MQWPWTARVAGTENATGTLPVALTPRAEGASGLAFALPRGLRRWRRRPAVADAPPYPAPDLAATTGDATTSDVTDPADAERVVFDGLRAGGAGSAVADAPLGVTNVATVGGVAVHAVAHARAASVDAVDAAVPMAASGAAPGVAPSLLATAIARALIAIDFALPGRRDHTL